MCPAWKCVHDHSCQSEPSDCSCSWRLTALRSHFFHHMFDFCRTFSRRLPPCLLWAKSIAACFAYLKDLQMPRARSGPGPPNLELMSDFSKSHLLGGIQKYTERCGGTQVSLSGSIEAQGSTPSCSVASKHICNDHKSTFLS